MVVNNITVSDYGVRLFFVCSHAHIALSRVFSALCTHTRMGMVGIKTIAPTLSSKMPTIVIFDLKLIFNLLYHLRKMG